jgi:hypothetical protein
MLMLACLARWLFATAICAAVLLVFYCGCRLLIFQATDGTPLGVDLNIPCERCGYPANWVYGNFYTYECLRCGHVQRAIVKWKP